ncbi:hypothetical protein FRB91_003111 [Serendipita sp. 411]|nr:hypothetical protein FRB91_003111 [Serendipita sp. 411]
MLFSPTRTPNRWMNRRNYVNKGSDLPPQPNDVWSLYNEIADPVDGKYIKTWQSGLNGIMTFAALFAGVISTLLIESKQLLKQDSNDTTNTLLYFLATQTITINHTDALPLTLNPAIAVDNFKPPVWALLVNGSFLISLTFSVLAALGAIVCLEWVLEYDDPPESAPSIKHQALRRHFRFQAMKKWYMGRLIITLPLMLHLVVVVFFVGLTIWVWHTAPSLAILPLIGVILAVGGSLFTNVAAIISPCVPFQTVVTKGMFRVVVSVHIGVLYAMEMAPLLFERWRIYLLTFFQEGDLSTERKVEQQFHKNRLERTRDWKRRVQRAYPWMPAEPPFRIGVHADRREAHTIQNDNTLKLSALAWLANSIELFPDRALAFACILQEMNSLEEEEIRLWGTSDFEAPWGSIFGIVVKYFRDLDPKSGGHVLHWRGIVAELQAKMVNNPQVFSRIVSSILQREDVYEFLWKLRAITKQSLPCDKVMEGLFAILSQKYIDRKDHNLCFEILGFILEYLEHPEHKCDRNLLVTWVFPLCATAPGQLDTIQWDSISDETLSFESIECSSVVIREYIKLVDEFMDPSRPQDREQSKRAGIYSNNQYVAIALLTDYLVQEHHRYHQRSISGDVPSPQHWALKLVRDTIIGMEINGANFQNLCQALKLPETSLVSAKVIRILAASMTLSHWEDVFNTLRSVSPKDLNHIYQPVLLAFVNADLFIPEKQSSRLRKAGNMIIDALRLRPTRQHTSDVETGVARAHSVSTSARHRKVRSTPMDAVPLPAIGSNFLGSLLHVLQMVLSEYPDSAPDCIAVLQRVRDISPKEGWNFDVATEFEIRSLRWLIDERRDELLPERSPELDTIGDLVYQLLPEPPRRLRDATATADPRSSSFGNDILDTSVSDNIARDSVALLPTQIVESDHLSLVQEQPEELELTGLQAHPHSSRRQAIPLPAPDEAKKQ